MAPRRKIRLDHLLVDRGFAPSRERARAIILAGIVLVGEERVDKAGAPVAQDAEIRLLAEDHPYVSRGGLKLKGALDHFGISVRDLICLDVGASTGGFTDCLLQEGAAKVYAVDVGYGQLAWRLRQDRRVVSLERTNIRYFSGQGLDDPIDFATIDASFISLKLVVPAVIRLTGEHAAILALVKPQFEVGRQEVQKRGVVKNPSLHARVLEEMKTFFQSLDLDVRGLVESTLRGPAGNREFFMDAVKSGKKDHSP
jgi:23S rRNA (cytidine1920-2'-O)/16S rRNA (cytidine1409-2'-O)-methyltransferase